MGARKSEAVRVRRGGTPSSLVQHRPVGCLRFVWSGVLYERCRRRDAIGLPVFERAAVQP